MGFYFDVYFDDNGQVVTTSESSKLTQELLKIILEDKGSNLFHKNWGCDVRQRIGTKKTPANALKVELSVRNAVQFLQNLQESSQATLKNMLPSEIIATINSVTVTDDGPDGYRVTVSVTSQAGDIITHTVQIGGGS